MKPYGFAVAPMSCAVVLAVLYVCVVIHTIFDLDIPKDVIMNIIKMK